MIALQLGDSEFDTVEQARQALRLSRSEFVRGALTTTLPKERPPSIDSEAVKVLCRVAGELTRLAWNKDNKEAISQAAESIEGIRLHLESE